MHNNDIEANILVSTLEKANKLLLIVVQILFCYKNNKKKA